MIDLVFSFSSEVVMVRIDGINISFMKQNGLGFVSIEGIRLDYNGVCREFPDLELKDNWKEEAIKRFKEKIKLLNTEDERADYIIEDLKKHGYTPMYKQRKGFRIDKIN